MTCDEGPHSSFPKYEYAKNLFAENVGGEFLEYPVATTNYYQGHWIPHLAQSNLFAVPEPLRSECLDSFLKSREVIEMGLVKSKDAVDSCHHRWVEWANVVFDKPRRGVQEVVLTWLEKHGLVREEDDLDPMTDWESRLDATTPSPDQTIFLAGRFAQWKYSWTDDCVLRGLQVAKMLAM